MENNPFAKKYRAKLARTKVEHERATPAYDAYKRQARDEKDRAMGGNVRGNLRY